MGAQAGSGCSIASTGRGLQSVCLSRSLAPWTVLLLAFPVTCTVWALTASRHCWPSARNGGRRPPSPCSAGGLSGFTGMPRMRTFGLLAGRQ
eukprot:7902089-Alexandrium_andersonii.AAC.1